MHVNDITHMNQWVHISLHDESPRPCERHGHTLCAYKNKLFLFGGTPDGSSGLNDVMYFEVDAKVWASASTSGTIPSGRYRHSAVVIGSRMYIFGGYRSKCLGDLYVLDLETMVWTQPAVHGTWPSSRSSHSACVWETKMVIFGGSGHKYSNELFILETETMTWKREDTIGASPSERWCHTAVMFGRKMFVFGGSNDRRRDAQVYVLDLSTLEWSRPVTDGCGPQARQLHSATAIGQCMVIFGGWVPHTELSDVHVLNTHTLTWLRITPEWVPPCRQLHAVCSVLGKMIVFGGYSKNKRMNDFYSFMLEHNLSSLQDLCVETLVAHLPQTLPHLHLFSEELLLCMFRKMGQSGKLSQSSLELFLNRATLLTELSLVTCSDMVDDAWIESMVLFGTPHTGNLLKLDLSNCRKISDQGLRKLTKFPSLRVVLVDGDSEVTCEGVQWIKRKIPGVSIVRVTTAAGELLYNEFVK